MAGAAAKKALKAKSQLSKTINPALLGVNLFYYTIRLFLRYSTSTKWHFVAPFLCGLVYGSTYSMAIESSTAPPGSLPEYSLDILILTLSTQALAAFSDKAWLLLLLIPTFTAYKAITLFVNRPKPTTAEAEDSSTTTGKAKKQKVIKQRRGR
mmetsp:Transcript_7856/g.10951  ORF Transcript_7856/g.10951 Transcript_7856/m.10951 type:complete len:153 (+) Transcript_7856:51-509(+)